MFYFGKNSKNRLSECHFNLQNLFNEVIKHYNCAVICGRRGEGEQDQAVFEGRSIISYPLSKHNKIPSQAADVIPWFDERPHIRWRDREAFYFFGGFVLGTTSKLGIKMRWGGDWDKDRDLHDQNFFDLPHFELIFEED